MIGAIAGDSIGSIYEFNNIKTKDFPLFQRQCQFTDDTVCTVALADSILHNLDCIDNFKKYSNCIPMRDMACSFTVGRNLIDGSPTTVLAMGRRCGSAQ